MYSDGFYIHIDIIKVVLPIPYVDVSKVEMFKI